MNHGEKLLDHSATAKYAYTRYLQYILQYIFSIFSSIFSYLDACLGHLLPFSASSGASQPCSRSACRSRSSTRSSSEVTSSWTLGVQSTEGIPSFFQDKQSYVLHSWGFLLKFVEDSHLSRSGVLIVYVGVLVGEWICCWELWFSSPCLDILFGPLRSIDLPYSLGFAHTKKMLFADLRFGGSYFGFSRSKSLTDHQKLGLLHYFSTACSLVTWQNTIGPKKFGHVLWAKGTAPNKAYSFLRFEAQSSPSPSTNSLALSWVRTMDFSARSLGSSSYSEVEIDHLSRDLKLRRLDMRAQRICLC